MDKREYNRMIYIREEQKKNRKERKHILLEMQAVTPNYSYGGTHLTGLAKLNSEEAKFQVCHECGSHNGKHLKICPLSCHKA